MSAPHDPAPATEVLPEKFRSILSSVPLVNDLATWRAERILEGGVGRNSFSLARGDKRYFIKETRKNESYALKLLHRQNLRLAPVIHAPELLDQNVLLADFIPGGKPTRKRLDKTLIQDFVEMQNALNNPEIFAEERTPSSCKFMDRDDGFFRSGMLKNRLHIEENITALKRFHLPIVDEIQAVAEGILSQIDALATRYAAMPFAWQHHDFREGNILGNPQRLVDWGSSYGHGPFLFDLAPFLIDDPEGWSVFVAASDICRRSTTTEARNWLLVAVAARFIALIKERIRPNGGHVTTAERAKVFLEYEFAPFRQLANLKL